MDCNASLTPPRSEPTMIITKCAEVAQLVEHSAENAGVVSSILTLGTTIPKPSHVAVERE